MEETLHDVINGVVRTSSCLICIAAVRIGNV